MIFERVKRFLCYVTLFFFSTNTLAWTCEQIASVCIDGPSTKQVQGHPVYRDCWQYRNTVTCYEETAFDYCTPLDRTPGCNRTSFQNNNGTFTNLYECGYEPIYGKGIIELGSSYTLTTHENVSECASLESNTSCRKAGRRCVDGPGTRIISDVEIYQECWKWVQDYTCQTNYQQNFCSPLISAGCVRTSSECVADSPIDGSCMERMEQYSCADDQVNPGTKLEDVIHLDTTYTLASDVIVDGCVHPANSPYCFLAQDVCAEGAETRNVDGLDVYKDCWRWDRQYACLQDSPISDCDEFIEDPFCTEQGSECILSLENGQCSHLVREFKCEVGEPITQTITDCGEQMFCMDGQCFDTNWPPDRDFGKVISMMEAVNQFGYGLFQGQAQSCASSKLWGAKNCCKTNNAMAEASVASVVGGLVFQAGKEYVKASGSNYVFTGFDQVGSFVENAVSGILTSVGFSTAAAETIIGGFMSSGTFGVTVSYVGAGGGFMGSGFAFAFNPVGFIIAIVILIITMLMECDEEDFITGAMRKQGLCYHVGSWCASKVLGSCEERRQGYCCFPSKLARIIQEQGRRQIGLGWGDPENPNCRGFTEAEIARIDFDKIDFSEFIGDIIKHMPSNKNSSHAEGRATQNIIDTAINLGSYYDSGESGEE